MSATDRKDMGVRVAGEKAVKSDEFVTKSQVVAGTNVTITYVAPPGASASAPKDIIINTTLGGGGGTGVPARMITDIVELLLRPTSGSTGYAYAGIESSHAAVPDRKYFGSAKFIDITHNWGLSEVNGYLLTIEDLTYHNLAGEPHRTLIHSKPESVGLDANTIRIYGIDKGIIPDYDTTYLPGDTLPSGGLATDLGQDYLVNGANGLDSAPSGTEGYVRFNFTLQEII